MSNANVNLEYFVPVSQYVIGSVHLSASMHSGVLVLFAIIKALELCFHWGIKPKFLARTLKQSNLLVEDPFSFLTKKLNTGE